MSEQFLTPEGLEKLKNELKNIKTVKRPELIQRIKNAKELGDLSENADYQSAKEDQGFMEGRVLELENLIKNATIITKKKNNKIVSVGSQVKIKTGNQEIEYMVTGSNEADPLAGKISNESPLGQAMMDRKKNEEFTITTPNGEIKYKILEIK
ncbi:transcription elongation factor GreA [Candidatus Falkowbacteria bacterium]|jgi:transcription elongation factor GreA|nr:transcription elongation factor GreA [Candidatus Falkowbacteria bacterium]MBT4433114.1 transcription elongation factor GreA [Candidatus Falkowbacteria bacterium]